MRKTKRIITESERQADLIKRQEAIIESFGKEFNKIKRIDENGSIDIKDYYGGMSKIIISKLPQLKEGFTRLWRGNRANEVGKNPSYTNSLVGIALPFYYGYDVKEKGGAVLSYIDIPSKDLKKYVSNAAATDAEFMLPKELLSGVKLVAKNIYQAFEDENFKKLDKNLQSRGAISRGDDAMAQMFPGF